MKMNNNWRDSEQQTVISSATGLQSSQLMILLEDELKDMYWTEKELTKAIPKMVKNATSEELVEALEYQLAQTPEHIYRIEQVFDVLGKKATAKRCKAMEEIIKEGKEMMDECDDGAMCDAGIISAVQKIEHYEIASYGILRQFSKTLKLDDVAALLEQTLNEEKDAVKKLSEIAVNAENIQAEIEEREEEF